MKTEIILFSITLLSACNGTRSSNITTFIGNAQVDTIVTSKTIPHEISTLEFKEKEYFLVAEKDTSNLSCIFSENKRNGDISVSLDYDDFHKSSLMSMGFLSDTSAIGEKRIDHKAPYYKMTYRRQIEALRLILGESSKEFDLSKVKNISLILLCCGDLAIEVTEKYVKKAGTKISISRYKEIENILADSRLRSDLDKLFRPYAIFIDHISVEKAYFAKRKDFLMKSKVDSSINVPEIILNCFIYVNLKNRAL